MQKDGPADEDDGTDDKGMTEEGGGTIRGMKLPRE